MNANNTGEEKVREVAGPLKALQGRESRPVGRYQTCLVKARNVEMKSTFTGAFEPMWILEFEYLDQPGNTHAEFVAPYNSKGSKAYKLGSGMTKEGSLPENIRADVNKFAAFFESKIGEHFEITLVPNRSGSKNIIGSIRPLEEKELAFSKDEIPF